VLVDEGQQPLPVIVAEVRLGHRLLALLAAIQANLTRAGHSTSGSTRFPSRELSNYAWLHTIPLSEVP
jgi:hypothetical protein